MQLLSTKLNFVKTSATAQIHNLILKKQEAGEKVINLSVGEPDFDTPQNIKNAAYNAIKSNNTKYTSTGGAKQLKLAIANKFLNENSLNYKMNEIIISSGGKQVIFNALLATLNENDEVIIPSPYWVSYPDMVTLCGGIPKIIQTKMENNFKLSPDQLKEAINLRTKWLILNSPCNPSGSVYTKKEIVDLCQILERFPHVHVLSDDIYEHVIYQDLPFYNIPQVYPSFKSRTLLVNGVSKSYAMTGWRIGYGAGSQHLINAMTTIQSQSTSNASSVSQYAAIEALQGDQEFIQNNKIIFQTRRDLMLKILNQSDYIKVIKPMGSFYALPSIRNLIGKLTPQKKIISSDKDFVFELLNETGVAVVPGSAFGAENTFRISYAVEKNLLQEACSLITNFANNLH
ncbi:MAG: pyridoxal phosphate-dependent aminotransferase [Paracoccaceae bacterium]|nr:pyridoxal phosphate-dependent aminotransferase [Paracoccaceae bacterium]